MGLFVNRPEEPSEWAGIPADPLEPPNSAERLGAPVEVGLGGLFGDGAVSVASIVIPLAPPAGLDGSGGSLEPEDG